MSDPVANTSSPWHPNKKTIIKVALAIFVLAAVSYISENIGYTRGRGDSDVEYNCHHGVGHGNLLPIAPAGPTKTKTMEKGQDLTSDEQNIKTAPPGCICSCAPCGQHLNDHYSDDSISLSNNSSGLQSNTSAASGNFTILPAGDGADGTGTRTKG